MAGEIITAAHGEEFGHFYDAVTGKAAYTIIGKNGKERNTTLADAKRLRPKTILVPGVTTILKGAYKRGLEEWKQMQVLLSARTLPPLRDIETHELLLDESEADWIKRVLADSKEQGRKAAERGTLIHTYIQQGFEWKLVTLGGEGERYFKAAAAELDRNGLSGIWECETTFACEGYGGKVDLWQRAKIIVDAKSTDKPLEGLKTWDDQHMQVALYRRGLNDPTAAGGILYVSTKDVAAKLIMIPEAQLQRGEKMGLALLDFWYAKSGLERA